MAEIKAFKALRYSSDAGKIETLVCPPYDIIPQSDYLKFTGQNDFNIIRAELPISFYPEETQYNNAAAFLKNTIEKGILEFDEKPSFYVYEIEFKNNGQTKKIKGFIPLVKIEEFEKGVILPHEETLSKAKADRFNLMKATEANFSQIYALYADSNGVFDIIEKSSSGKPDVEFIDKDDNNSVHRLWVINDSKVISSIQEKFANKKLYIADGHHRYETALNYRNWRREQGFSAGSSEYIPIYLVNLENDGLVVFPTHRILRNLEHFNRDWVIENSKEYFEITQHLNREKGEIGLKNAYEEGKTAFIFFTGDNNYTLFVLRDRSIMNSYLEDSSDALKNLDVSVLHSLILERLFGIDKVELAVQSRKQVFYTRHADEALAEVDGQRANCSFLLNPTRVSEIKNAALAGEKMPQKSTYFYPKLITGLVLNKII